MPSNTKKKKGPVSPTEKPKRSVPPLKPTKRSNSYGLYIIYATSVLVALLAMFWLCRDWFIMPSSPPISHKSEKRHKVVPRVPQFDAVTGALEGTFELRDIPGKGKGLIAIRDIKQGEMIIREKPLLILPRRTDLPPTEAVNEVLIKLTPSAQEAFFSLSYVKAPANASRDAKALAIVTTNAVSAGEDIGVFPTTARMNHGCSSAFNAVYVWRAKDDDGILIVHAIKDIKKDDEILTAYSDTKQARENRRFYLKHQYAFDCECAVCSLPPEQSLESDRRLTHMSDLYNKLATWQSDAINGTEAIEVVRDIWSTGDEEGYVSQRGRLANDAVVIAVSHSDEAARAWAKVAVKWYTSEMGKESTLVKECEVFSHAPMRHILWGSKEPMSVGGPEGLDGVPTIVNDPSLPRKT